MYASIGAFMVNLVLYSVVEAQNSQIMVWAAKLGYDINRQINTENALGAITTTVQSPLSTGAPMHPPRE